MALVETVVDGYVAVITMHDPAKRNALSGAMLAELAAAFDGLAGVRAVVLRARAGDPVWCAGFDIGALRAGDDPLAREGALQGVFGRVAACPAPVIGMLQGSAWGGGTDLALRCDMLVGDGSARLAFTPGKLGLPYDPEGLLNAMWRLGAGLAMEMFATAAPVGAARLLAAGTLNHVVGAAEIEAFTLGLAEQMAANAPLSVASAKAQIRAWGAAGAWPAGVAQAVAEGRTRALLSEDYAEGLAAWRERRAARFRGV